MTQFTTPVSLADSAPHDSRASDVAVSVSRNAVIDTLKFVAIALVVLSHVLRLRGEFVHLSPELVRVMVSFNMPLFAFLSGWVLAGREGSHPLRFLEGKVLGLLVPYLAWIAVEMPLRKVPVSGYLLRLWHALQNPLFGMQMWFLWALFWMFVVFTVGHLVSASDWWTAALAVAVACVALVIPAGAKGLNRVSWLYPYLVSGYLLSRRRTRLRHLDAPATVVAVAAFVVLTMLDRQTLLFRFVTGLAGVVAACGIVRFAPVRLLRVPAYLGKRSLGIYGSQMVVLPFLIVGGGWTGAMASWAIVLAASIALSLVLDRLGPGRAIILGQWRRSKPRGGGRAPSGS